VSKQPKTDRTSIRPIEFLTATQKLYNETIEDNTISIATGYPGTGKTYVACFAGLKALYRGDVTKIILTKPCVEVGNDSLGFLPGDLEEKMAPFIRSVQECVGALVGVQRMKELCGSKSIEVLPLNHMRGLTIDNSFVIADEMQNASYLQIKTFLTRIGKNTKYVLNGDLGQTDIEHSSGLPIFLEVLKGLPGIGVVDFAIEDIVRSGMLRDMMVRIYEYEQGQTVRSLSRVA
jgi:phosphate starvation-inducible PhoH-like protein